MPQAAVLSLILFQLLFAGAVLAGKTTDAEIPQFTVAVPQDVLRDYALFLAGRNPLGITDYSGPHSRRDVIEIILFRQALAYGGIHQRPTFETMPSYARILEELSSGRTAVLGTSAWRTDLARSGDVFISSPLVEDGQFEAGFYTAPGNARALNADSPEKLRQLSAACNSSWKRDWETLEALGVKDIRAVSTWENMVRLVRSQRVDFLLAPFQPTNALRLVVDGMILIPIPGIKVGLAGSRHFAVSKNHPAGKRLFAALQSGLAIMRSKGLIRKAYGQCGFFNAKTRTWRLLTAPNVIPHAGDPPLTGTPSR